MADTTYVYDTVQVLYNDTMQLVNNIYISIPEAEKPNWLQDNIFEMVIAIAAVVSIWYYVTQIKAARKDASLAIDLNTETDAYKEKAGEFPILRDYFQTVIQEDKKSIINALQSAKYKLRTIQGISIDTNLGIGAVKKLLDEMLKDKIVIKIERKSNEYWTLNRNITWRK